MKTKAISLLALLFALVVLIPCLVAELDTAKETKQEDEEKANYLIDTETTTENCPLIHSKKIYKLVFIVQRRQPMNKQINKEVDKGEATAVVDKEAGKEAAVVADREEDKEAVVEVDKEEVKVKAVEEVKEATVEVADREEVKEVEEEAVVAKVEEDKEAAVEVADREEVKEVEEVVVAVKADAVEEVEVKEVAVEAVVEVAAVCKVRQRESLAICPSHKSRSKVVNYTKRIKC
ncbi:hypothetical protein WN943_011180 [Citrus x changshan-huyou]